MSYTEVHSVTVYHKTIERHGNLCLGQYTSPSVVYLSCIAVKLCIKAFIFVSVV